MLSENARKLIELIGQHQRDNERAIALVHAYPVDGMPVNVAEIAHYRNRYLQSLKDHNETLGAVERLLTAGGEEIVTLWAQVYDDDGGRDSGSADPRQDGDHQG